MNIEEFYAADERRRRSAEVELGRDWRDAAGVRHELSWVEDTGELYVMREPVTGLWEDPFGDVGAEPASVDDVTVAVVGRIDTHQELEELFSGWQEAMAGPRGVEWIVERLGSAGKLPPSSAAPDAH